MKFETLKSGFAFGLVFVMLTGVVAFAGADDRTTEKTREAVENAGPHDWYTLAKSAEKCFKKNVNVKEAYDWLDQSLEIAEAPFNLELKGDYFSENKLPEQAVQYYVMAIKSLKENESDPDY